jgi:hypothetical protein
MKKLHTFTLVDHAEAGLLKELLKQEGVVCLIRNEHLFAALGEIPFLECLPELWVVDDDVWPRAKLLLDSWFKREENTVSWTCSACGETLEGQFGACWQCGKARDV